MKKVITLIGMAALSLSPATSNAENIIYIGAVAGATSVSQDDIDEGTSSRFFIGFNLDKHIALEAAFYTTGEANVTTTQAVTLETDGINISALYVVPDTFGNISTAFGAGVYIFETQANDPQTEGIGNSVNETFGASLHARAQYLFFNSIALRADLDVFFSVEAFDENKTVTSLMLGAAYQF